MSAAPAGALQGAYVDHWFANVLSAPCIASGQNHIHPTIYFERVHASPSSIVVCVRVSQDFFQGSFLLLPLGRNVFLMRACGALAGRDGDRIAWFQAMLRRLNPEIQFLPRTECLVGHGDSIFTLTQAPSLRH